MFSWLHALIIIISSSLCVSLCSNIYFEFIILAIVRLSFTLRIALKLSSKNCLGIYLGRKVHNILYSTAVRYIFRGEFLLRTYRYIMQAIYQHIIMFRVLSSKFYREVYMLYWYILVEGLKGGHYNWISKCDSFFDIMLFGSDNYA